MYLCGSQIRIRWYLKVIIRIYHFSPFLVAFACFVIKAHTIHGDRNMFIYKCLQ